MIVSPFRSQTPVRNFSPREAYAVLVDLCSCTDDTREQKKKKKTTQVLRRLPRLRMFRHLAPTLAEAVFLRTSAASDLVNGQAIRDHSRSLLDPGRHQHPATDECLLLVVVACGWRNGSQQKFALPYSSQRIARRRRCEWTTGGGDSKSQDRHSNETSCRLHPHDIL